MFTLLAPAKINWSLNVLNERSDGYHNIISLLQCIELFDELTFESSNNIEIISDSDIPVQSNLIYKSALALKELFDIELGAKIVLHKSIPSGAGLGGASTDAAHTLIGLNRLWKIGLDNDKLMKIGAKIGSDVPFFFNCPLAIVEGRGELVTPLKIQTSFSLLLVKPSISVSTALAYEQLRIKRNTYHQTTHDKTITHKLTKKEENRDNIRLIYRALVQHDFSLLSKLIENDFESIIDGHNSIIGKIKSELLDAGAHIAMMTGSGSVVFGLFNNRHDAIVASKKFKPYWHKIVNTLVNS